MSLSASPPTTTTMPDDEVVEAFLQPLESDDLC
ncbi:hypothetical protein QO012_002559 [Methylobacterium aerolatum]|uniref:Uncharacterized protein n=1 Tax=Methylobacterium aerolatum TaxID=418708 RepID=A0ABU0I0D3_9HYPH|nr:hypothetical protein [Methylobacterium aerolatum]GJD36475.1 hypothetical protein FMGBMHLM_3395 [Methylobacterium aerolatum]